MKNLFERMKPEVSVMFDNAEVNSPNLIKEVKRDLIENYFISDMKLNTAFIFCFFVLDMQLDYTLLVESFEKI